jgi:flotillin
VVVSVFPESVFQISLKDYEAYDVGKLPFVVDIRAFFRIGDSDIAAQRVSNFDELSGQLTGVLQGAVRRVLATTNLENIMEARSSLGEAFTREVDAQLKEWGVVTVKTIEFMDIKDTSSSSVIFNMMAKEQSRIAQESRVAVAENTKIAEQAEILARQTVELSKQEAEQVVGIRTAEKDQKIGLSQETSRQQIAVAAKTTAEKDLDVQMVQQTRSAEIARSVQLVQAEAEQKVKLVESEADKAVLIQTAEGQYEATVKQAEGELAVNLKKAEGVKALGEAEGAAETAKLMAPVNAQTTLAKEIGDNGNYQTYLTTVRTIEANEKIGIGMAEAIKAAEIKVIANSGSVSEGISSLGDLFTPKGGTSLAGMLSGLSQTEEGKALVETVTGKINKKPAKLKEVA